MLGRFELVVGERFVPLGQTCQRLLTLLAIRPGQVPRSQAAGMLWPETRTSRAGANLRSTIWRLQQSCCGVVEASFYDLRLASHVELDVRRSVELALRLIDRSSELSSAELNQAMRCNLHEDIVPALGEGEWLTAERERFRQLRVHALESLARQTFAVGWHGAAVEAALGAVRADPFRESAYQLLVEVHLAQGSQHEARRYHIAYCELLRTELGLRPSREFLGLLDGRQHLPAQRGAQRPCG